MTKWELKVMMEDFMMSDLEKLVALDMIELGYDFQEIADIQEFWTEKLNNG